jgi:hypothetical protein
MKGIVLPTSIRSRSWLLVAGAGIVVHGVGAFPALRAQEAPAPTADAAAPVISSELAEAIRQLDDDQYLPRRWLPAAVWKALPAR